MFVASYLQISRHGVYYFRIAIPRTLRSLFPPSKREIKLSLRTNDRTIACARARAVHVNIDQLFSQALGHMAFTPPPLELMSFGMDFDRASGRISLTNIGPGEARDAAMAMAEASRLMAAAPAPASSTDSAPATATNRLHKLSDGILTEVVAKYLAKYHKDVQINTFKRRAGHLAVFVDYFDDCKISAITRAALSGYWEDLQYIPLQKDVRPEHKDKKLRKLIENQKLRRSENDNSVEGLSPQTQAHYREAVSGFFEWCAELDIVEVNIATRKSKRSKYSAAVDNTPRSNYTPSELKRIFEHDFFRNAEYKHPFQYWIPHIAIYTGARINEIAQLYLDDIQEVDGFWAFKFCAHYADENEAGTRVRRQDILSKNESGQRLTPIHPKLVELGLIDFARAVRTQGHQRLFPELPFASKGGYGTRASRWYSEEFLRPKVGITAKDKVFHSFRHTVIDTLGDMLFDMPEGEVLKEKDLIIKAIIGHKIQGVTFGRYKKQFHPRITSKLLNPVVWNVDHTPFIFPDGGRSCIRSIKIARSASLPNPTLSAESSPMAPSESAFLYDGEPLPELPEL